MRIQNRLEWSSAGRAQASTLICPFYTPFFLHLLLSNPLQFLPFPTFNPSPASWTKSCKFPQPLGNIPKQVVGNPKNVVPTTSFKEPYTHHLIVNTSRCFSMTPKKIMHQQGLTYHWPWGHGSLMILSTARSSLFSVQLLCTSPVRAMKGWPDLEGHLSCVKASRPSSCCCFPVQHHSSSDGKSKWPVPIEGEKAQRENSNFRKRRPAGCWSVQSL